MPHKLKITDAMKEAAEAQIREKQRPVDYDTKEYPIEILIQKYQEGLDDDTNELFIPDYQREMAWESERQSKFIESVLLGLPIPYIFVADVANDEDDLARLEIIDGSQRIRTLSRFLNDELNLINLDKLQKLKDFRFSDLPLARQRRFKRTTIRMIQLTEDADEEVRRDLFERINTGSLELNEMEKRRGILRGPFLDLIEELSQNDKFRNLCAFSEFAISSREPQEFVLRFFAFLNNYENFGRKVDLFLNEYLKDRNENKDWKYEDERNEFLSMLDFVDKYLPNAFRKGKKFDKTNTYIKFESISVGVALALRINNDIQPKSIDWLKSDKFNKEYANSQGSSSKVKVKQRIEYVRDQLLDKS